MTLDPRIQRILDQLPEGPLEFQDLQQAIYNARYSGPLTFDFLNGLPKQINLGQPVKLVICQGGLDNGETAQGG